MQFAQDLKPIYSRHAEIEDDHIRTILVECRYRIAGFGDCSGVGVSRAVQYLLQQDVMCRAIIDDEDSALQDGA